MKKIILASIDVSALALATLPLMAVANEPGMLGPTCVGKIWVDAKGMTLYLLTRARLSNPIASMLAPKRGYHSKPKKTARLRANWPAADFTDSELRSFFEIQTQ